MKHINCINLLCIIILSFIMPAMSQTRWTKQESGTNKNLNYVTYANEMMITVGDSGVILVSNNGLYWVQDSSGTTEQLFSIAWIGTCFVAVGAKGTIVISNSYGTEWTPVASVTTTTLRSITWTGTKSIIVGDSGTILLSNNGTVWEKISGVTQYSLKSIVWSGSKLVAVGETYSSAPTSVILTSPDGLQWTNQAINTYAPLNCIQWNGTQFVAVGKKGTVILSKDGITWERQVVSTKELLSCVTYFTKGILACADTVLYMNRDGSGWRPLYPNTLEGTVLKSLGWVSRDILFLAVGYNGAIFIAREDDTWVKKDIVHNPESAQINITISGSMLTVSSSFLVKGEPVFTGIYSSSGRLIMESSQMHTKKEFSFSIKKFTPGIYHIIQKNSKEMMVKRFIISG